jgi:hypothetical protein
MQAGRRRGYSDSEAGRQAGRQGSRQDVEGLLADRTRIVFHWFGIRRQTPSCHHAIMPSCHHAIMPSCHHAIMPSCHHAIMPSCHHAIMRAGDDVLEVRAAEGRRAKGGMERTGTWRGGVAAGRIKPSETLRTTSFTHFPSRTHIVLLRTHHAHTLIHISAHATIT